MTTLRSPLAATVLLIMASACAEPTTEWSGEVRDSAGVQIVDNRGAGLESGAGWSVESDLSIGGDESRPETIFGYVADVAVDAAGRMYVLDQPAQRIRVFSPEGDHVADIGRPGDGPGELSRFAGSLIVLGDTLMVADWGRARMHRFLLDGSFVDARLFPGQQGARSWWRLAADGRVYFRRLTRYVDDESRWRGGDALFRSGGSWEEPDSVFAFSYEEADLGGPGDPKLPLLVNAPSWEVLSDGGVAWTLLDATSVFVTAPDGTLRRTVTRDAWRARPPDGAEQQALIDLMGEKLAMLGGDRNAVHDLAVEQPSLLPAVTTVRVDPRGRLWVQTMGEVADIQAMALNSPDPPIAWGGGRWDVFDGDGRFLTSLHLPPRFRVSRLTDGAIYGVVTDDLGVERVLRLRLTAPAPG